MTLFWIIGILLNVVVAGLGIWWVVRQMKPPGRDGGDDPA